MKKHWKFIVPVVSIILSSALLLTGCMAAIVASTDTTRPYQLSAIPQTIPEAGGNPDTETVPQRPIVTPGFAELQIDPELKEPPVSQEELKAKFSAMYDFSKGNKTVSVISEAYLDDFWSSNYEKEVVHSLSIPEVLYIIQDSIRIYNEYDTIRLVGFSADTSDGAISSRFPALEQQTISPNPDDRDQARGDVRKIIQYRLQALSSPEAFFTVAEMMEYRKNDLAAIPDLCREVFFYIPGYTADTNRNLYLNDASYCNSRSHYGVFCFSYFNRLVLFTCGNPETVYPTKELSLEVQDGEAVYLEMSPSWLLAPEYYGTLLGVRSFVLDSREQTFYITTTVARFDPEKNGVVLEKNCPDFKKWPGTYEKIENRLYLYPFDIPNAVLVFDCDTDGALVFNEAESDQIRFNFEDKSIYYPIDHNP